MVSEYLILLLDHQDRVVGNCVQTCSDEHDLSSWCASLRGGFAGVEVWQNGRFITSSRAGDDPPPSPKEMQGQFAVPG